MAGTMAGLRHSLVTQYGYNLHQVKPGGVLGRKKRRLTAAEKKARRERKLKFMTIFINGKQERVPRPPTIDGMPVDEFIARNADPIWLHQNELWWMMPENVETSEEPPTQPEPPEEFW